MPKKKGHKLRLVKVHMGKVRLRHRKLGDLVSVDTASMQGVASDIIQEVDSVGGYSIPVTGDNVSLLSAWMANEGGLWANNPLNTSLWSNRYAHQFNGSDDTGIPIYPNIMIGIEATAETLVGNSAYAHILAVLKSGSASCTSFGMAVIDSPWASSHYGYDPSRFCTA